MPAPKQTTPPSNLVVGYLVFYNAFQTIGWSLLGLALGQHVVTGQPPNELYSGVSSMLKIFQTAAILEVVHCAVGLVRSSVVLTAFQVASRVMVVWGVLHISEDSQQSVGFTLLLTAWTITEIIRYSFYVVSLPKLDVTPLVFLRYTLFIVLYPIGVTGELLCLYSALPYVERSKVFKIELPNAMNFAFDYKVALIVIMLSYIPIFPQLYLHMFSQRRKVLGGGPKAKTS